jgi:hypothetical protein
MKLEELVSAREIRSIIKEKFKVYKDVTDPRVRPAIGGGGVSGQRECVGGCGCGGLGLWEYLGARSLTRFGGLTATVWCVQQVYTGVWPTGEACGEVCRQGVYMCVDTGSRVWGGGGRTVVVFCGLNCNKGVCREL